MIMKTRFVVHAQAILRKRILRTCMGRGLLEGFEAKEMLAYRHSGFSVDSSVCMAAHERAGQKPLLRCWVRVKFRLVINPFLEQFGLFLMPDFQCLNG